MADIFKFFDAVDISDLYFINTQLDLNPAYLNQQHPIFKYRAIDRAAQLGHSELFSYLVKKNAVLTPFEGYANLLYSISQGIYPSKRKEILLSLMHDNLHLHLGDNIDMCYINAVLMESYNPKKEKSHGGLLPLHYATLAGNKQGVMEERLKLLNEPIGEGYFAGTTLSWLLVTNHKLDLFSIMVSRKLYDQPIKIKLNVSPVNINNPDRGKTIAWLLAYLEQWDTLSQLMKKNAHPIEGEACPLFEDSEYYGVTLFWMLAFNERWDLFSAILAQSDESIDLNSAPSQLNHEYKGVTLLWLLVYHEKWDLLTKIIKKSPGIKIDLNAAPATLLFSLNKSTSAIWLLLYYKKWKLAEHLLSLRASPVDINLIPNDDDYDMSGISVLWHAIAHAKWELAIKLINSSHGEINLNASPTHPAHTDKDTSLFYFLICQKAAPELVEMLTSRFTGIIDLESAPCHVANECHGITLAWWLGCYKNWVLFAELARQYEAPVNLNAEPLNENNQHVGRTITHMLLDSNQIDLLSQLLGKYFQHNNVKERFDQLIWKNDENEKLTTIIDLLYAQNYQLFIDCLLEDKELAETDKFDAINNIAPHFFGILENFKIENNADYYKEIQQIKAHISLVFFRQQNDMYTNLFLQHMPNESVSTMYTLKNSNLVRRIGIIAYTKAQNPVLTGNLIDEILFQVQALSNENEKLKASLSQQEALMNVNVENDNDEGYIKSPSSIKGTLFSCNTNTSSESSPYSLEEYSNF